jgi:hypothetical protein
MKGALIIVIPFSRRPSVILARHSWIAGKYGPPIHTATIDLDKEYRRSPP